MAGVLATQKFLLEDRFDQLSSAKYKISGRIDSPNFEFISIFDDNVRGGKTKRLTLNNLAGFSRQLLCVSKNFE